MTGFWLSLFLLTLSSAPAAPTAPEAPAALRVDPAVIYGGTGPVAPWTRWLARPLSTCLSEPRLVFQGLGAGPSADGALMAFTEGTAGRHKLRLLRLSDGQTWTLAEGLHDNLDGAPSPDGSTVYFSSNRKGSFDLYSVSPEGGEPLQLTRLDGDEMNASPSPRPLLLTDPKGSCQMQDLRPEIIVFEHRVADRSDLRWVDDTGTKGGLLAPSCAQPSWSSDGSLLLAHCEDSFVVFRLEFPVFDTAWQLGVKRVLEVPDNQCQGAVLTPGGTHLLAVEANAPRRLLARPVASGSWEYLPLGEGNLTLRSIPGQASVLFSRQEGDAVLARRLTFTCDFNDTPFLVGLMSDVLRMGALGKDGLYLEDPTLAPIPDPVPAVNSAELLPVEPLLDTFAGVIGAALQAIEEEQARSLWLLTDALWKKSLEVYSASVQTPDAHYAVIWAAVPMLLRKEWMPSTALLTPPPPPGLRRGAPLPPPPQGPRPEGPPPILPTVLPEDLPLEIPPSVKADLATVLGHIAAGRRVELGVGELGHPETKVLDGAALLAAGAGEDNLRWYRMALVWYATMPLPLGRHATAISLSIHQDPELWRTWNELESWAEFRLGPATNPGLLDLEAAFTEHPDWVLGLPLRDYQAYLTERLAARRGQLPLEDHAGATLLAARRPLVTQAGRLLLHPAVDGRRAAGAFDDLALFGKPEALQAAAVPPPEELWAEADLRQAMAPASKLLASIIADREPDLHTRWLGLLSRLLDSPAELAVAPQPPTWLGSPAFAARRLSAALHGQALLSSRRPALPQHLSVLPTAQSFCNPSMGKFALAPAAARPDPTAEPLPAFYAAAAELALSLRQRLDTTQVPSEACDTSLWSFCEDPSEWLGRMASLFTILAQISTKQLNDDPLSDLERQQLREIQAFLAVQPTSPKGGQLQLRLLHRQGGAPVLLRGLIPALEAPGQTPPPWLRFFVLPPAAPTNPSQEP